MKTISFIKDTLDFSSETEPRSMVISNGTEIIVHSRGVIEVIPNLSADSAFILSSGIHGNETSPIEILDSILNDIQSEAVVLSHPCLFIYGHPEATLIEKRFIDTNLNRLFTGYHDSDNSVVEIAIANDLMQHVDAFYQKHHAKEKWHLDLHCAIRASMHYTFAIHPYNSHYQRSEPLLAFLANSYIEACLYSEAPASTFSWYSAEFHGAHAATVELGKVARLGENDLSLLSKFSEGLVRVLCESNNGKIPISPHSIKEYQVTRSVIKKSEQFAFHFPSDLANFTLFKEGSLLAKDDNEVYCAQKNGERVVFPNESVEIGHRACLLVQEADK